MFTIFEMTTRNKRSRIPPSDDFFNDTPVQPVPQVEEVQITNDMPETQLQKQAENETASNPTAANPSDKKPSVPADPRPHITSTPAFKYFVIGLVVVALIVVIIFVVKKFILQPKSQQDIPDERDEAIEKLGTELRQLKDESDKMSSTISQLRRENQLQSDTIKRLNEDARFDKDGKPKENSYSIPEPDTSRELTEKEKLQQYIKKQQDAENDTSSEQLAVDAEDVEGEGDDDEYEYEDAEEEVEEPGEDDIESESEKVIEIVDKPSKKSEKKSASKKPSKKSPAEMNDEDILALVTSQ